MARTRRKPWQAVRHVRRPEATRNRRRVLIVCEDSKSACLYFKAFNIDPERAEVVSVGTGMNTDSLVAETVRLKNNATQQGQPFGNIWCVLDRDSFPLQNYSRAFQLAGNERFQMAWANEAFELWYLLHFNYHDAGISRTEYQQRLNAHLTEPYDKADDRIFEKIYPYQQAAMRNARRLEKHWREMGERFPERQNPSTSVHKLVEFLNELAELGPT
jgi:hypothetical protein